MNKKPSREIPAPFHAAVIFTVFFTLLGTPLSEGNDNLGGLRGLLEKVQALFYGTSSYSRDSNSNYAGTKKGGRKYGIMGIDPTTDPPPPPPPPPKP